MRLGASQVPDLHKKTFKMLVGLILIAGLFLVPAIINASIGDGVVFAAPIMNAPGEPATLSLTGGENINITPTPGGELAIGLTNFTINTTNYTGYNLTMTASTTNTDLINGSNSSYNIPTFNNSSYYKQNFPAGYWAYSIDNNLFTSIPAENGVAARLKNSDVAVEDDSATLYVGVRITRLQMAAVYSNVLVVSAVANPITYDIVYDANANEGETIGNMPSSISTTTPNSYITISNKVPTRTGYTFAGWSEDANSLQGEIAAGSNYNLDAETDNVLYLYAIWQPNSIGYATYLQQITPALCSATEIGITYSLKDIRDENTYTVAKFDDDRCWMTQNLRLDLVQGQRLTSDTTDLITKEYYTVSSTTRTAEDPTIDWGVNNDEEAATKQYSLEGDDGPIGNYYSWYTATAGSGKYSTSNDDLLTADSICPKGWQLPSADTYSTFITSNNLSTATDAINNELLNLSILPGYYNSPDAGIKSIEEWYLSWTSQVYADNSARARLFSISIQGGVDVIGTTHAGKTLGAVIRCVARKSETYILSYNSNDGQDIVTYDESSSTADGYYDFTITDDVPTAPSNHPDYTFLGWGTSANQEKGPFYHAGDTFTSTTPGEVKLYAIWEKTFYLFYDANGGTSAPSSQSCRGIKHCIQTVSSDVPTKDGSAFLGWARSSTATNAQYNGGNEVYQSGGSIMLYAVWGSSTTPISITTMQEMTAAVCNSWEYGKQYQLRDTRDGKYYYVSKLGDGRCWMTQNLDLEAETTLTLTSDASDVDGTYTLPASITLGDIWETADLAEDLIYYNPGEKYYVYSRETDETIAYDSLASCSAAHDAATCKHYHVGNYYTWDAATFSNGYDSNNQAAISICPKGWQLPSYSFNGSLRNLATVYGMTKGDMLTMSPVYLAYGGYMYLSRGQSLIYEPLNTMQYLTSQTSTSSSGITTVELFYANKTTAGTGLGANDRRNGGTIRCVSRTNTDFTLNYDANGGTGAPAAQTASSSAGRYSFTVSSTEPTRDGYEFLGWSFSNNASLVADFVAGDKVQLKSTAQSYTGTIYAVWGIQAYQNAFETAYQNAGKQTYEDTGLYTLQDMNASICAAVITPATTDKVVPKVILLDTRDEKTYYVSKLADGNCWMTQNLGLDGDIELTPDDSDSNDNFVFTEKIIIGTTSITGSDLSDHSYWSDNEKTNYVYNGSSTITYTSYAKCVEEKGEEICQHTKAGNIYNSYTRTAGYINETSGALIAPISICPKGWQLPVRHIGKDGNNQYYKSYQNLLSSSSEIGYQLEEDSNYYPTIFTSPFFFIRAGYYWSTTFYSSGYYGLGSADSNNGSDYFNISSTPPNYEYSAYKTVASSIRCVARTNATHTITYNANGGTGAPASQTSPSTSIGHYPLTISNTQPTMSGYTFAGWSDDINNADNLYQPGDTYVAYGDSNTLYAMWEGTYTLNYDANGGTNAPAADVTTDTGGHTFTITEDEPTRSGYTFVGWNLDSTSDTPNIYANDEYRATTSTTTIYAIWGKNTTITTMQEMTPAICASLDLETPYALTDVRDNKKYLVSRLKADSEGNTSRCWMIENLDLDLSTEQPLNNISSNLVTKTEWTPSENTGTRDEAVSSWNCSTRSGCMGRTKSFDYGRKDYGNYYSLSTASAESIDYVSEEGTIADSICPKGWTIPTGKTDGDFGILFNAYGLTANAESFTAISGSPINMHYVGYFYNVAVTDINGRFEYWSSTMTTYVNDGTTRGSVIYAKPASTILGTTYVSVPFTSGYSIRCIAENNAPSTYVINYDDNNGGGVIDTNIFLSATTNPIFTITSVVPAAREGYTFLGWTPNSTSSGLFYNAGDNYYATSNTMTMYAVWAKNAPVTYMQDMSYSICQGFDLNTLYVLTDERDDKKYTVARIKMSSDGTSSSCWMTQNLDLDLKLTPALTSETTDLVSKTYWYPKSATQTSTGGTSWSCTSDTACANKSPSYDLQNSKMGNLYSWYAATAGSGTYSMSSGTTTDSICPKGWRLPTGNSGGDYGKMLSANSIGSSGGSIVTAAPYNFVRSGYYYTTSGYQYKTNGYYWSSSVNNATSVYIGFRLYGDNTHATYTQSNRFIGYSVRCIARESATYNLTYNANGGSGAPSAQSGVGDGYFSFLISSATPTYSGKVFLGWSTASDATVPEYVAGDYYTATIFDSTLYAVWGTSSPSPTLVTNMQDMSQEICATWAVGSQYQLKDTRDNKMYYVAKFADGNCWMTQNLDLGDASIRYNLTPEDTDTDTNYTLPVAIADGISWEYNNSTNTPYFYDAGEKYYVYDAETSSVNEYSSKSACEAANSTETCAHYHAGNYYTFAAATLESKPASDYTGTAESSVCPKGWILPRATGNRSYNNYINTVYGLTHPASLETPPFYLTNGGWKQYNGGNVSEYGNTAYYLINSVSNINSYADLFLDANSISVDATVYKGVGTSIRCVVKASNAFIIAYDANGGENAPANQTVVSNSKVQEMTISNTTPTRSGYTFVGWSTNANDGVMSDILPGSSYTVKPGTTTLYAVWTKAEFDAAYLAAGASKVNGYYTMQAMTPDICSAVTTPDNETLETPKTILIDTRDSQLYLVAKLADGNCWMTQDLDLGNATNTYNLTSANSDLIPGTTYTLPVSITRANNAYSDYGIHNSNVVQAFLDYSAHYNIFRATNSVQIYTSLANCQADGNSTELCSHGKVGNFYTWAVMSAGTRSGKDAQSLDDEGRLYDIRESICPTGWTLPVGGTSTDSLYRIRVVYNTSNAVTSNPFYSSFGATYYRGKTDAFASQNSAAGYASSTEIPDVAYRLTNVTYSGAVTSTSYYKGYASLMRCQARKKTSFTLNYDANGGENAPISQTAADISNGYYSFTLANATPTRAGFTFAGWATTMSAKTAEYQPGGQFIVGHYGQEETLYAVWTSSFTLNFSAPGASNIPATQTVNNVAGDSCTFNIPNTTPTKSGYTFLGWSKTADSQYAPYIPGGYFTTAETSSTLYAIWQEGSLPTPVTITNMQDMTEATCASWRVGTQYQLKDTRDNKMYYVAKLADGNCWMTQNLDLGDMDTEPLTLTPADSDLHQDYTLPEAMVLEEVDDFMSTSDSTKVYLDPGQRYKVSDPTTGEIYLYTSTSSCVAAHDAATCAHYHTGNYYNWRALTNNSTLPTEYTATESICPKGWQLPTRNLTTNKQSYRNLLNIYEATDDSFEMMMYYPAYLGQSGAIMTSSFIDENRAIYTSNYNTLNGYISSLYIVKRDGFVNTNLNTRLGFVVRCLARKDVTYTLSYNANGGNGAPSTQTSPADNTGHYTFTISATTPTRDNYAFMGWSTDAAATEANYQPGGSIVVTSEKTTLYAVWQRTMTLTYNANGGSGAPNPESQTIQSATATFEISSTIPTRDGYYFLGWATEQSSTVGQYTAGNVITIMNNTVIYAIWSSIEPTTLSTITYMQEMTPQVCAATAVGNSKRLLDNRDNKYYWVTKLLDGHCWMTQNLDLDLSTSTELTNTSTGLESISSWTPNASTYTSSGTGTTWTIISNVAHSYDPGDVYLPGGTASTTVSLAGCISSGYTEAQCQHWHIGNYYKYYAASAGTGVSISTPSTTVFDSICPKGWKLPAGSVATNNQIEGNYATLFYDAGIITSLTLTSSNYYPATNVTRVSLDPYYLVRGGYYSTSNAMVDLGTTGNYIQAKKHLNNHKFSPSTGYLYRNTSQNGESVRCIAQYYRKFILTYNANGGEGAPSSQVTSTSSSSNGTSFVLNSTVPTRENYIFVGWGTSATASTAYYRAGDTFTTTNDVTELYAIWARDNVKISYDANGGSGAPGEQYATPTTYIGGSSTYYSYTISTTTPTRNGYTFVGWSTSATATNATYRPGQATSVYGNNPSDVVLYAVWSFTTVTLSYNANGGSGAPASQSATVEVVNGTQAVYSFTLSSTIPTRSGYVFIGWARSADSTHGEYAAGSPYNASTMIPETILYAIWSSSSPKTVTRMQDVTKSVCESWPAGTQYQLTDTRDNKQYYVARLADGNCWMTQNLDFGGSASSYTLTPSDSDVTSNITLPGSISLGFAINSSNIESGYYYYDPGDNYVVDATTYTTLSACQSAQNNSVLCAHAHQGNYYSWYTATAGTGLKTTASGSNAPASICPRGWKLPSSTDTGNLGEGYGVSGNMQYSSNSAIYSIIFRSPMYISRSGQYSTSSIAQRGSDGLYATSTKAYNTGIYTLDVTSTNIFVKTNATYSYVYGAIPVRCIARLDSSNEGQTYNLIYSANGGSGAPASQTAISLANSYTFTISSTVPTKTNYSFLGWSTSPSATSATYTAGGTYTVNSSNPTAYLYAVWQPICNSNATSIGNAVCMQDVNANVVSSMLTGVQYQLSDRRDNKKYYISKFATSSSTAEVWMTQNLDLDLNANTQLAGDTGNSSSVGYKLSDIGYGTTSSSNVWTSSSTYPLRTTASTFQGTSSGYTDTYSYNAGDYCLSNGINASFTSCTQANNHYHVGNYYQYNAAVAGSIASTTTNSDAPSSICPYGWRLPADNTASAHSYQNMLTYNDATTSALVSATPYYLVHGGYASPGSTALSGIGNQGAYRTTRTSIINGSSEIFAYRLALNTTTGTIVNSSSSAALYASVRCVARATGSVSATYTLTYNANGGTNAPASQTGVSTSGSYTFTVSSSIPTRVGYTFLGWSTSSTATSASNLPGSTYTATSTSATLYAVWKYTTIKVGNTMTVPITYSGEYYYFAFTPTRTTSYAFYSTGSADTYGYLYNASGTLLASNDNDGTNNNFDVTYTLTAGNTYYYAAKYSSNATTGTFYVGLSKNAVGMTENGTYTVNIDEQNEIVYFYFTPSTSGSYDFISSGTSTDTYGYIYDSNFNQLAYDDDSAGDLQFKVTYNLTAGVKYYYGAKFLTSTNATGSFSVTLTKTVVTFNISYNYNGGYSGTYAPTSCNYGGWCTVSTPTRSGYTFTGWTATNMTSGDVHYIWYENSSSSLSTTASSYTFTDTTVGSTFSNVMNLRNASGTVTLTANWSQNASSNPLQYTGSNTFYGTGNYNGTRTAYADLVVHQNTAGSNTVYFDLYFSAEDPYYTTDTIYFSATVNIGGTSRSFSATCDVSTWDSTHCNSQDFSGSITLSNVSTSTYASASIDITYVNGYSGIYDYLSGSLGGYLSEVY